MLELQPDFKKQVISLIESRDVRAIVQMMFSHQQGELALGFHTENDLWDFKEDIPRVARGVDEVGWAKLSADVLAFHNNSGGFIIFGICDKSFDFVGATHSLDTKQFNDKIRRYCGDKFWVTFSRELIKSDQHYLGIAIIPPKAYAHQRVLRDGPLLDGKPIFRKGDLCFRVADETRIFSGTNAIEQAAKLGLGVSGGTYAVDEPNYRVLRPDYKNFVIRKSFCDEIQDALASQRTFVTSITGIGGVGKTALSCWMTLKAYEEKAFDYIVSVSARDRALTASGIVAMKPTLTSLEDLLTQICQLTGFSEYLRLDPDERIQKVQANVLAQFRGLLFVDNLETVDDARLIKFLEKVPMPTKVLVTSRRARIRVANYPIELGAFDEKEAIKFLNEAARSLRKEFIATLSDAEKKIIVEACDRVPLIIEWLVGRAKSGQKAVEWAKRLRSDGRHGEELLEFSFRRVYDEMTVEQHGVLQVLAISGQPLPIEAIAVGADLSPGKASDVLDELQDYGLLERVYDSNFKDIVYSVLSVTGSFVSREVSKRSGTELDIRKRLSKWYQADDVKDSADRLLVQQVRRGERNPENTMLEIARHAEEQGNLDTAESFFKQAVDRNLQNWRCHFELARFLMKRREIGKAIRSYARAAEFSPKQGPDRARIFKDWALAVCQSGMPSADKEAAEHFMVALRETPIDFSCRLALGECDVNTGRFSRAIEVLKPIETDHGELSRQDVIKALRLLERSYVATNEVLALALLRQRMEEL